MSENPQTWEHVISEFFSKKKDSDEEKHAKELLKGSEAFFKKTNYYDDDELKVFFDIKKNKRDQEKESSLDFQRRRILDFFSIKDKLSKTMQIADSPFENISREKYKESVKEICEKYNPKQWIPNAATNASSVNFATHVSKLTHSKIDSSSIYDQINSRAQDYLTTSSLLEKAIDGAVAGNQFAPIFQFLELECNGIKMAVELSNPNSTILSPFSEGDEYLEWNKGFGKALVAGCPSSHLLAKQVYFPLINSEGTAAHNYHLLCNLKSSSMAQAIFERLFSDKLRSNQKTFYDEKYSDINQEFFPRKGRVSVTASNHSNASQLNGKRGGKLYLFSAAPPIWHSQQQPPFNRRSLFTSWRPSQGVKENINYLRDFLLRFERINISIQNPDRRKWINSWVGNIVEEILIYAASIQNDLQAGWTNSKDIRLKQEHQLFLDPYRQDELFQMERKTTDWQLVVQEDFARWLNTMLKGTEKKFTPQRQHTRMWMEIISDPLREHNELASLDFKTEKVKI